MLYSVDHGSEHNGKPAIHVRCWDFQNYKRIEAECYIPRYADDSIIHKAKCKLAEQLNEPA